MKVIVGLGNPGKEYEKTRHNVGFMVLDRLVEKVQSAKFKVQSKFVAEIAQTQKLYLVKPMTFMNGSGTAVAKIVQFYKIELQDLWVIHDDLDIVLGEYKIQFGKGPKVHNGLSSIESALGTKEFWRVRIGIDNRNKELGISGETYVLNRFLAEEKPIINEVIGKVADEIVRKYL